MKFYEKLIKLRKEKGLSQEELGYELNVTRQTISKWELGQTTPEMDKLLEMAKFFGVSLDELTGDSDVMSTSDEKENKRNAIIIIVFVAVLLVTIILIVKSFLGVFAGIFSVQKDIMGVVKDQIPAVVNQVNTENEQYEEQRKKALEQINSMEATTGDITEGSEGIFNTVLGVLKNTQDEYDKKKNESEKRSFNLTFETNSGTISATRVQLLIDDIIKNNQTGSREITLKYNDVETADQTELRNLKRKFDDFTKKYEVYFEYDENGYVSKAIVEKI